MRAVSSVAPVAALSSVTAVCPVAALGSVTAVCPVAAAVATSGEMPVMASAMSDMAVMTVSVVARQCGKQSKQES